MSLRISSLTSKANKEVRKLLEEFLRERPSIGNAKDYVLCVSNTVCEDDLYYCFSGNASKGSWVKYVAKSVRKFNNKKLVARHFQNEQIIEIIEDPRITTCV